MADDLGIPNEPSDRGKAERMADSSKSIAQRIEKIMKSLEEKYPEDEIITRTPDNYLIEKHLDGRLSISAESDQLKGHGYNNSYISLPREGEEKKDTRGIYLAKDSKTNPIGFQLNNILEINTPYELFVGIHTDRKTLPQMEELYRKDPTSIFLVRTHYYFDKDGRYGKAILLPPEIEDDRPVLKTVGKRGARFVKCDMDPGDFELAGFAVGILEKGLGD